MEVTQASCKEVFFRIFRYQNFQFLEFMNNIKFIISVLNTMDSIFGGNSPFLAPGIDTSNLGNLNMLFAILNFFTAEYSKSCHGDL